MLHDCFQFSSIFAFQVGFFKAIVCPLYSILTAIFRDCRDLEDGLLSNLEFWQSHPEAPPQDPEEETNETAFLVEKVL